MTLQRELQYLEFGNCRKIFMNHNTIKRIKLKNHKTREKFINCTYVACLKSFLILLVLQKPRVSTEYFTSRILSEKLLSTNTTHYHLHTNTDTDNTLFSNQTLKVVMLKSENYALVKA